MTLYTQKFESVVIVQTIPVASSLNNRQPISGWYGCSTYDKSLLTLGKAANFACMVGLPLVSFLMLTS